MLLRKIFRLLIGISAILTSLVCGLLMLLGAFLAYELHPWLAAGQSVEVSHQQLGDYYSEIWQRKNSTIVEPFSTGLFLRKGGAAWRGVQIGFEDEYKPKVRLRRERKQIQVFVGGKNIGSVDLALSTFKRQSDGVVFSLVALDSSPPDNWPMLEAENP